MLKSRQRFEVYLITRRNAAEQHSRILTLSEAPTRSRLTLHISVTRDKNYGLQHIKNDSPCYEKSYFRNFFNETRASHSCEARRGRVTDCSPLKPHQ